MCGCVGRSCSKPLSGRIFGLALASAPPLPVTRRHRRSHPRHPAAQLRRLLKGMNIMMSDEDFQIFIHTVDTDKSGEIHYNEFLAK
jgi:hypothetical protein